jgi:hypothetical protein
VIVTDCECRKTALAAGGKCTYIENLDSLLDLAQTSKLTKIPHIFAEQYKA